MPATNRPTGREGPADPSSPDNVLHPVDGNPVACPPPLCPDCFPSGWPELARSVGCQHGMWIRDVLPDQTARTHTGKVIR